VPCWPPFKQRGEDPLLKEEQETIRGATQKGIYPPMRGRGYQQGEGAYDSLSGEKPSSELQLRGGRDDLVRPKNGKTSSEDKH